nr:hypothetical protein CFP56_09003 [Quercus suber]
MSETAVNTSWTPLPVNLWKLPQIRLQLLSALWFDRFYTCRRSWDYSDHLRSGPTPLESAIGWYLARTSSAAGAELYTMQEQAPVLLLSRFDAVYSTRGEDDAVLFEGVSLQDIARPYWDSVMGEWLAYR